MNVAHSSTILAQFRRPRNHGPVPAADVVHEVHGEPRADRIRIEFGLESDAAAPSLPVERVEGLRPAGAAAFPAGALRAGLAGDGGAGRQERP